MKFTAKQIESLKKEFSAINTVVTDDLPKFHSILEKMDDEALAQVVKAGFRLFINSGRVMPSCWQYSKKTLPSQASHLL